MRQEEIKYEFGIAPSYDESTYHLAIIEKRSGKFVVYLDLEGIRFFLAEIIEAVEYSPMGDHSMIYAQGEHDIRLVAPRLDVIRLFIDYPQRAYPNKPPAAYRKPTGVLEMVTSLEDARQLFDGIARMADRASRGREVKPLELPYGVSVKFKQDWDIKESYI